MSCREDTDAELYEKWSAGDQRAGGELSRRYLPMLRRLVCDKVSDATVAKDVLSTTLLQLVKSHTALKDPTHFRAFVIGIARNVLKNHYRKHSSERLSFVGDEIDLTRHTLVDLGIHPPDPGPGRDLVRALHRLPIEDQQILMVHYEEKLSYTEIAVAFDLEVGTVASRLYAAKGRLREAMRLLDSMNEPSSTASEFADWAHGVRRTLDSPTLGVPRKVGRWRQVKFEPTGFDTFRVKYRRWLQSSIMEIEVRRPVPDASPAIGHGPVGLGERDGILEANRERDTHGLRITTSAGREIVLTHRKASNWDGVIDFARKLDLDAIEAADLPAKDLHGVDLRRVDLRGANLHGANLEGANLAFANLEGADLRAAKLAGAQLAGANLRKADLRGVALDNWAQLIDAELEETILGGDPEAAFEHDNALLLTVERPDCIPEALELASALILTSPGGVPTPIVVGPADRDCRWIGDRSARRRASNTDPRSGETLRLASGSGR